MYIWKIFKWNEMNFSKMFLKKHLNNFYYQHKKEFNTGANVYSF